MKHILFAVTALFGTLFAFEKPVTAVVNFGTCVQESKYGKNEQQEMEKIKQQWSNILEQTEKEYKEVSEKLNDQEYMDGLSPEAEKELKQKAQALQEDMMKYQNQLYQTMNQANYIFFQKMANIVMKASEEVAKAKKIDVVVNKDALFYYNSNLELTDLVIEKMDKIFESEKKTTQNENDKNA